MNVQSRPTQLISTEEDVTPFVLSAMENTDDPRVKEIVTALVRHLHAFVREVRPTEAEFEKGLQIVNPLQDFGRFLVIGLTDFRQRDLTGGTVQQPDTKLVLKFPDIF